MTFLLRKGHILSSADEGGQRAGVDWPAERDVDV